MWYFTMTSKSYGAEEFGPYDTKEDASARVRRIRIRIKLLADATSRKFTLPYRKDLNEDCI